MTHITSKVTLRTVRYSVVLLDRLIETFVPDIHAIMINDKVRTSTYAHFILTNPALFNDAVVLDVGCGTGILSLFAARSGAKRVIAVDASDIAEKAERIVEANGFQDIITVIRGKVEEITLPDDIQQVDIIVSEWMGYALLYESMLDSVLHARDRFLRPNGVMAPSQCRIMLGLCDASEIFKDRIGFWSDVYGECHCQDVSARFLTHRPGFDLSAMATDLYDDAIIDVVGPHSMLSEPYVIKVAKAGLQSSLNTWTNRLAAGSCPWRNYAAPVGLLVVLYTGLNCRETVKGQRLRTLFRHLLQSNRPSSFT